MRFVKVVLHFVVADSFLRFAQKIHVTLHQVVFIATHICICVYHFLHLHPHRYFVLSLTEPIFLYQGFASICPLPSALMVPVALANLRSSKVEILTRRKRRPASPHMGWRDE